MGISTGYGRAITSGSVFAFDTADVINSYKGEPTTNHIYHQNARIDSTYESYMPESGTGQIAANHPGAIRVYNINAGDISYYLNTGINTANSGIEWYNTRHAYWIYDTILKRPVVRMYNEIGVWQAKYFGLGIASLNSIGATAGTQYTVSWLQYVESLDRAAHVGVYSYSTTYGYYDFWDGLQNGYNTTVNTWQRVSVTFTATNNGQLNSGPSMYFYGHNIGGGELRIADVQLEVKTHATQYSSTYTRSTTDALKPLVSNSSIDLSNVSFDANAQMYFDGTNDYVNLGSYLYNIDTSTLSIELVFKTNTLSGCLTLLGWHENEYPHGYICLGNFTGYWANETISFYNEGPGTTPLSFAYTNGHDFLLDGLYHHVVFILKTNEYKIYVDGAEVAVNASFRNGTQSTVMPSNLFGYGATPSVILGAGSDPAGAFFNGVIPVTKIYNRALSEGEVKQNYNKYKSRFKLS